MQRLTSFQTFTLKMFHVFTKYTGYFLAAARVTSRLA